MIWLEGIWALAIIIIFFALLTALIRLSLPWIIIYLLLLNIFIVLLKKERLKID
jgi:hypothetical protein